MNMLFYIAAAVAVICTLRVITHRNAVHALLYLIVSLLAVAMIFFLLGAPFAAALEVIVYAGAIMVLFVFVVMMLNLGARSIRRRRSWMTPGMWIGPAALAAILLVELAYVITVPGGLPPVGRGTGVRILSQALFGPYVLGVELTSLLLLAGLVGAYHLARPEPDQAGGRRRSMITIPTAHGLLLAGVLFFLGLMGILVRRNIIFILLCLEIMLNAAGLAFIVAGSRWGQPDGQIMFLFILAMAAAEVSVGLALVLQLYHRIHTLDTDRSVT